MKARLFPLIGAIAASLALASCGVRTGLEQPPPMWGKARANYFAEQERVKAEAAARAASATPPAQATPPAPNVPVGPSSPLSPIQQPAPASTQPPG